MEKTENTEKTPEPTSEETDKTPEPNEELFFELLAEIRF